MSGNKLSLTFKPTNQCNLQCAYCYAENLKRLNASTMTLEESKQAFDWILRYCQHLNIDTVYVYWHGGEPLLPGPAFMQQSIEYYTDLFKRNGIKSYNHIQTNLLNLNEDFYPLMKQYFDSMIGTSYDFHSATRLYFNGRDSSQDVYNKILKLQADGFNISVICLLNKENVGEIDAMYSFFNDNRLDFTLNRIIPPLHGPIHASELALSITWEEYANALCHLFDIWYNDKQSRIQITPLKTMFKSYVTGEARNCNFIYPDARFLMSIGPGGELYPCARFDASESRIGTIYDSTPEEVIANRQKIVDQGMTSEQLGCSTCDCYGLCTGGCLHSRIIGWQPEECNAYRAIWKHMAEVLTKVGITRGSMRRKQS
ncbi:MAG: radical SAM protein [Thermoguttaceae bacterium]|nr:radical SAM protein [Thermoguttaceae bacterium]